MTIVHVQGRLGTTLVLADKPRGPQGPAGTAATVAVGTVTTGAPGSSAAVTNSGTSTAAVLDVTIPRGDKGDKGDTGADATAKQALIGRVTPRQWAKVYRVNNSGSLPAEQTGSAVYATIAAALAAVATDRGTVLTGTGYDAGPEHRALILIDPGTYSEQVSPGRSFVDLVGSSGNAADVIITQSTAAATLELAGDTHYVANLTLRQTGTASGGGIYPMHTDSSPNRPGSTAASAPQQKTFVNVVFESQNANRAEAAGVGLYQREMVTFIDCVFKPMGNSSALNMHNTASQKWPATCTLVDCTINSGSNSCFQVSDLGSGQPDRITWIGGALTTTGANQVTWVTQTGTTLQLVLDPTVATKPILNNTNPSTVVWARSPWSLDAIGGRSGDIDAFYGPSSAGVPQVLVPPCGPDANATLVANRLYYLPVEYDATVLSKTVRVMVGSTPAGIISAGLWLDDGTGKPGGYMAHKTGPGVTLTAGALTITLNYLRRFFPGYRRMWLGLVVDNAASKVATSSTLSGMVPCYYQDLTAGFSSLPTTATPVALTAGDVVPIGAVVTQ